MEIRSDIILLKSYHKKLTFPVLTSFIIGIGSILSSILSLYLSIILSLQKSNAMAISFSLIFCFLLGFGFLILLADYSSIVNYLIVCESGILIRKPGILSCIKHSYISFESIIDVEILDKYCYNTKWIVIYIKDQAPFVWDAVLIENKDDILKLIKNKKKNTYSKSDSIFVTKRTYKKRGYIENLIPLKCNGIGTEGDPFVIMENQYIPKKFYIYNYESFIVLNNIEIEALNVENCKNLIIRSSKISYMSVSDCFGLKVENSRVFDATIKTSKNCEFFQNGLTKIKVVKSENNLFKNNRIFRFKQKESKNNILENCYIEHISPNSMEKEI